MRNKHAETLVLLLSLSDPPHPRLTGTGSDTDDQQSGKLNLNEKNLTES